VSSIIDIINATAFVAYIGLATLALVRMTLRIMTYYILGNEPSVILRRDMILLGTLLIIFGMPVAIQFFGAGDWFAEGGPLRLPYTIFRDIIGVGGLAYYVWVEYFIIGRPGKEDA